jgi:hypothetical protein
MYNWKEGSQYTLIQNLGTVNNFKRWPKLHKNKLPEGSWYPPFFMPEAWCQYSPSVRNNYCLPLFSRFIHWWTVIMREWLFIMTMRHNGIVSLYTACNKNGRADANVHMYCTVNTHMSEYSRILWNCYSEKRDCSARGDQK